MLVAQERLVSIALLLKAGLGVPEAGLAKRVKSTPDPDTFEEYRDTPPIFIAILVA